MRKNNIHSRGFTLIELMITIAIVGILASVAYPSYTNYVKRGARAEAMAVLLDAANKQEQYFVDNRVYTADLAALGVPTATENGYFTLAAKLYTGGFILTATAAAGPVKGDTVCTTLTIDETGAKNSTGTGSKNDCWER
ncbi:type IV pilin protein [Pseudoalteromonas fenneropenaei]|uniref:Type IV pilin protein n=1 Tax=Pseudoalteromonas fenneropenaei TaxID=1737459 RepID=A0ABV7CMY3_9GAMM